jgi:hypothetical protein
MTKEFNNSMRLICPEELTKPRFVQPSGISKADAKKICLKYGVVWGCD